LNQLTTFARGTLNTNKYGISGTALRTQSWDHDALGNFDSVTTNGTSVTRSHNKQNEITSVSGAITPTYDAEGNLTTGPNGQQYVYDAWNQLVAVKNSGGSTIASFAYDGTGRRIVVDEGSVEKHLYYSDQWQVLEERVGGNATAQYIWSPTYIDALILRDRDTDANGSLDERLWPLYDANWNVTALVNNSGNVVERFEYDPFGAASFLNASWGAIGSSAYAWTQLYQGLAMSAITGLIHARNRDLDPVTGRPLTRDPKGFGAGDANVYRWEGNNTPNLTDPYGLDPLGVEEVSLPLLTEEERLLIERRNRIIESRKDNRNWLERNFVDFDWFADNFSGEIPPPPAWVDPIPFVGDAWGMFHYQSIGDDVMAAISAGGLSLDLVTLGGASLIKAPVKVGGKVGIKELGEQGGEKFIKDGTEKIAKEGAKNGKDDAGKFAGKETRPCFVAGTPIRTPGGFIPIEQLQSGMVVLSRNEFDPDGPVAAKVVDDVFVREAPTVDVRVGDRVIRGTLEHPFWVDGKGWVGAMNLMPGDRVRTSDGRWAVVEAVRETGQTEIVYNFRVAEWHTYFVGDPDWGFDVWVHNVNKAEDVPSSPSITPEELAGKSADEIRQLAKDKGLVPHPTKPDKWMDPFTGKERLRIDPGHIDKKTGLPYNDPKARVPHHHGYGPDGKAKIVDPNDGNPHFPTR
jgi:RHS repeat-associated protein